MCVCVCIYISIYIYVNIHLYCVQELLQAMGRDDEPVFSTNGASRCDITQGAQGKKKNELQPANSGKIHHCAAKPPKEGQAKVAFRIKSMTIFL